VTVLRSPSAEESGVSAPTSIGELAAAAFCDLPLVPSSGFAHSRQNFAVGGFSALQDGHRRTNGDAHSTQNFARSGFSAPHFEQRIANAPNRSQDVQTKARFSGHRKGSTRSRLGAPIAVLVHGTFRPRKRARYVRPAIYGLRRRYDEILCLSSISKAIINFRAWDPATEPLKPAG